MKIKKKVLGVVTPILQLKRIKAACVIFDVLNRRNHVQEYQKIRACSIIQSRLSNLFKRQKDDERIRLLRAASVLSRFAKVQSRAIFYERLKKFLSALSCYKCPICCENLDSKPIEVIQPCGHIHCKDCFDQIGTRCPYCHANFEHSDCKSVSTFLSQSNPKFFFTRENPEKKAAIAVIGGAMKRHLVDRI